MTLQMRILLAFILLLAVPAAFGGLALQAGGGPSGTLALGLLLLHAVLAVGLGLGLAARVGGAARRLADSAAHLAQGQLGTTVPGQEQADEMGSLAKALEALRVRLRDAERQAGEATGAATGQQARGQRLEALLRGFADDTREMLEGFRQAAQRLDGTAGQMTRAAEAGQRMTGALVTASEGASGNAQTAAAATEELAASIGEITRQVGRSAEVARRAVAQTEQTDRTVRELAETASKIGEVVRLIADIAGQTNLLALNATIEAARAGDAGKGFAVVASEVKSLASQTARATEEIGQQVGAIQGATALAVEAIRSIGMVVTEIDQTSTAIAAAVQQQGAATREIARNIAGTAEAAGIVSRETGAVRQAGANNGEVAREVRAASVELNSRADTLRAKVDSFLTSVRAA